MSRRAGSGARQRARATNARSKSARLLVFGESENDRRAIKALIEGLQPELERAVETRKRPLVLLKNADLTALRERAAEVADTVLAADVTGRIGCVFVHEDLDDPGRSAEEVATKIEAALRRALNDVGLERVIPFGVVPAEAIEAWWLLWPDVLDALQRDWTVPRRYRGVNVDAISKPKRVLERELTAKGSRRPYRESDSEPIAQRVKQGSRARTPVGTSPSYSRFFDSVDSCAAKTRL